MNDWNDELFVALSHPIRRRILECFGEEDFLSFNELLRRVGIGNHGRLGYHIRALKGLVERTPSGKKFCLTDRGQIAVGLLLDFRFKRSRVDRMHESTEYVRHLRFGDHAFLLLDTEVDKREVSFPYLEAGLSRGEAVVYVVSEDKLDSESGELQKYGIAADYFRNGAFTILSADEWYLKKGKAEGETIIANWRRLVREKQNDGFTGVRAAGEMDVFFNNAKVEELFKYEVMLGRQFPSNICALCIYDANRLHDNQVHQLINCHTYLISRDIVWKI